jgi:peptidoglycan hydrolase-like protein with peptidoglycan-binding domain
VGPLADHGGLTALEDLMLFRTGLAMGVAAALLIPVSTAVPPSASSTLTATALPTVNMEATVKAAQIDPRRADHTFTAGAKASVLAVEQALHAKNLLAATWVDGYFGSETVAAYARYQTSLGYTGLDANGLPGRTSLTKLGQDRFTVTHLIGPGPRLTQDSVVVNTRTREGLQAVLADSGYGTRVPLVSPLRAA